MKKLVVIFLVMLLLCPMVVKADDNTLIPNAKSGVLMEESTGKIIFEKNKDEKVAVASMTKMVAQILILEAIEKGQIKWTDKVTASANASSMGGSQIFLEENEIMKVEDMLKGVTIGSANDATVALAERIAGTEEAFVSLMNKKAKELGLKNTNFKNCTGLDEANHYSSSYDMAMIAKELVKHSKILEFSSIYETYLRTDTDNKFWLVNTNKLVRFYKGVDGLKTGYTDSAGYCLTATINKEGMRLIAVGMGENTSSERNKEVSALLDYGYNLYQKEVYLNKDEVLGTKEVEKGIDRVANIVLNEDVASINKKGYKVGELTYELDVKNLKAPIKKGEIVGSLTVKEDGKIINKVDVTVDKNIDKAGLFTMYIRHLEDIVKGNIKF
mgnify:CR=1 FL=1